MRILKGSKIIIQEYTISILKVKAGILLLLVMLLLNCTSNTFENEEALLEYLKDEENGYIKHKSVNGYDFTLMYRPTDLLVKQELGDSISKYKVRELREKYSKYLYFNLRMGKNNEDLLSTAPKNRNEFGAMVNQLAFGMGKTVHLFTQSKDTLELVDYVYPRMYGVSRSTTMMFVYPRDKEKLENFDVLNFTIEDLGLYTGEVKFKINSEIINSQPKLSFKN